MKLNLSNEDYHGSDGLSKSSLAVIDRSPAHFKVNLEEKNEPTPAMKKGTMVHTAILEPDEFHNRYVIAPSINRRTNAGKQEWADFQKANEGKELITEDDLEIVTGCQAAITDHPAANALFSQKGVTESSFFWDKDGVQMRCRPDYLVDNEDGTFDIIDLKTSADASPWAFKRSVTKFKYDLQEAIYREGVGTELNVRNFYFVVIEPYPPFAVAVYVLDSAALKFSTVKYQALIDLYNECVFLDEWPAYSDDIETLELTKWQ